MEETEGSLGSIWSQISVETEEAQSHCLTLLHYNQKERKRQGTEGLLMLFLVPQQRSNNEVLYEAFELMIWSSAHVRRAIRRVGADCRKLRRRLRASARSLIDNHPHLHSSTLMLTTRSFWNPFSAED